MRKILILALMAAMLLGPAAFRPPAARAGNAGELLLSGVLNERLYRVTSELEDPGPREFGRYGAHNLFDGKKATCWAEGRPDSGLGEALYVDLPRRAKAVWLVNGYPKRDDLFQKNNRLKTVRLSLLAGFINLGGTTELFTSFFTSGPAQEVEIELADSPQPQRIALPFSWPRAEAFQNESRSDRGYSPPSGFPPELAERFFLKLVITGVYRGSKWDDTCLSELWFE